MIALYRTLSGRYLLRRWDRAALIVLSIALGVATLVSTRIFNQCIDAVVNASNQPAKGQADLFVGNGESGAALALVEPLRSVAGVRTVVPLLVERLLLADLTDQYAVLVGLEVPKEPTQGVGQELGVRVQITHPLAALDPRGALIGTALAQDRDRSAPGPQLRVRGPDGAATLRQIGLLDFTADSPLALLGRNLVVMDVTRAAELVGRPGVVSRIDVYLQPGADVTAVQAAIRARIGPGILVRTPEAQSASTQEVVGGIQIGFTLCGIGALIIGLFLVYNALSVSVAERRQEIGILRAIGASQPQIAALFAGEAVFLGGIGALTGLPIGVLLAHGAIALTPQELKDVFLGDFSTQVRLSAATTALALGGGMMTALLAALVPALSAANEQPADAVRRSASSADRVLFRLQAGVSGLLATVGVLLVLYRAELPYRVGTFGGMVLALLGLLLAIPLFVSLFARSLQPLARRLLGIEARLAADNLLRAPGRTGVVVGALSAGVALLVQVAGVGKCNEGPILEWVERAVTADLFVFAGTLANATSSNLPLSADLGAKLQAEVPGIAGVLPLRYHRTDFRGIMIFIAAVDGGMYHRFSVGKTGTANLSTFEHLHRPGTVIVSDNFAALHRVAVGDTIAITAARGELPLEVIGVVPDYSWSRGTLFIDRNYFAEHFADPRVDVFSLYLDPTADRATTTAAVTAWAGRRALNVTDRAFIRQFTGDFVARIYRLAYLQQGIIVVVATLGVVTALLISVLQRRRELGLLRAVGATQTQVVVSVLAEATLMGLIGTLLGIVAGVLLEWYIVQVIIFEETGFWFPLAIPWLGAATIGTLAVGLATLAGLLPALHAMRLNIAEAIAYE
jgi:putative ABC transport system permease protein